MQRPSVLHTESDDAFGLKQAGPRFIGITAKYQSGRKLALSQGHSETGTRSTTNLWEDLLIPRGSIPWPEQ